MTLLTNDIRMQMLNKQFGAVNYTPTASYSVAAVTVVPDDEDGNGLAEPTDPSYARVAVSNVAGSFEASTAGTELVNATDWVFPQATEEWGSVFGIALFDASATYIGYVPFSTVRYIDAQNILKITAGAFKVASADTPLSISIEEALMPTILTAPNGNRYAMSVSNAGALVLSTTTFFGVPAAPLSLINTSGTLSWTAPASNGGTPIISYTIWVADSSDLLIQFDVVGPTTLSFDTEGVTGVFYVTADNTVGSSAPSNFVTIA